LTFTLFNIVQAVLIDNFMAGPNNLFLSFPEAKLLHLVNLLLVIESCDATRRGHRWDCWYSRAILLANAPIALLASYNLYRLFRA
jgi:hypothetical protein